MRITRKQIWLAGILLGGLAASLFCAPKAQAQSEEADPAPALGEFEAAPLPPPDQPFLIPDVPQSLVDQTQIKERWFTAKFGLVVLADYNSFQQDANSLSQVGRQPDGWDDRSGAPELVARFSNVDLDGGTVAGGKFNKTYLGVNWWATRRWKFGFGWGHTWLDRFAMTGVTDSFQTRFQWIY